MDNMDEKFISKIDDFVDKGDGRTKGKIRWGSITTTVLYYLIQPALNKNI